MSTEILTSVTDETLKSGHKCDASSDREILNTEERYAGR